MSAHRLAVAALSGIAGLAAWLLPAFAQPLAYHDYADDRAWLGIANLLNVLSSAGFFTVGALGLWSVLRRPEAFERPIERTPYVVFFVALMLTALGSSYYHAAPDNERLFWDRLPMTMAFTSLIAAQIGDRIDVRWGVSLLLPMLGLGAGTVIYWRMTERAGAGNLTPYAVLQLYTIAVLLLLTWLHPSRYTEGRAIYGLFLWYMAAKLFEMLDAQVFAIGEVVSGHALKHVAAAIGAGLVWRMIAVRTLRVDSRSAHTASRTMIHRAGNVLETRPRLSRAPER